MSRVPKFNAGDDADRWYCDIQDFHEQLFEEVAGILTEASTAEDAVLRLQPILDDCNSPDSQPDHLGVRVDGGRIVFENDNSGDFRVLVRGDDGMWWLDDQTRPKTEIHQNAAAAVFRLIPWGNLEDCEMTAAHFKQSSQS
jgi:hypothetical protein